MNISGHVIGYSGMAVVAVLVEARRVMLTAPAPATNPSPSATSSCKGLQETLLTGTEDDINAQMAIVARDKAVNDSAREWAKIYSSRDRPRRPDRRARSNLSSSTAASEVPA
jgi:hypothetical protein